VSGAEIRRRGGGRGRGGYDYGALDQVVFMFQIRKREPQQSQSVVCYSPEGVTKELFEDIKESYGP
jgi:hypothetical protein